MTMRVFCILTIALLFMSACSPRHHGSLDDPPLHTAQETRKTEPANFHYAFDNILVPREMELQPKLSFVFAGPQIKAGIMTFRGRVDAVSLTNFFLNNMPRDGWQLSSSFKYRRAILVFTKPDRDCIINIIDGRFFTTLEIWIAPKEARAPASVPARSERILTQ
jgi:hypothetical protein